MFIDDFNKLVQKQVFAMLKAKEEYDLAVSNGKMMEFDYEYLELEGLSIDEAIAYLQDVKNTLRKYNDASGIVLESDSNECGIAYISYKREESDVAFKTRISMLANDLERKRLHLELIERTRDFYLAGVNNVQTI
jgi:hypothetical protein